MKRRTDISPLSRTTRGQLICKRYETVRNCLDLEGIYRQDRIWPIPFSLVFLDPIVEVSVPKMKLGKFIMDVDNPLAKVEAKRASHVLPPSGLIVLCVGGRREMKEGFLTVRQIDMPCGG